MPLFETAKLAPSSFNSQPGDYIQLLNHLLDHSRRENYIKVPFAKRTEPALEMRRLDMGADIMGRKADYDIVSMILNRWSERAMSGEPLTEKDLMPLFEAARWAPSAFNAQPWRFLYALRGSAHWPKFFDVLVDFNKQWVKNAGALIPVLSRKLSEYDGKPNPTHSFDTGSAWENLALEGTRRGLVVHAMSGFSYEKARLALSVPEEYNLECMIAVGKRGKKEDLPLELQKREVPSDRKPVKDFVTKGPFKA